jgi:hypothetical protein
MSIRDSLVRTTTPSLQRILARTAAHDAAETAGKTLAARATTPASKSLGDRLVRSVASEVDDQNLRGVAAFISHISHEIEFHNLMHNSAVIPPRQAMDRFSEGPSVKAISRLMGALNPTTQAISRVSGTIRGSAPTIPVLYPWYAIDVPIQRVAGSINRLKDPETLRSAVANLKELLMPLF